ncbi:HemK2/MTQ2 family protein methyltransferase [Actinomycetospora straminea]|uniref:Methyltransferase n=1 Tax=Actinomycetospora straminea TaxID=663607 RepID=A0ABP9F8T5_9PSEU|nr:HemK2/MTQ2 family protein methyltransferase [Actinomycetospora straminea]MDD7933070.1 methyltransferase [Actinomycetospora straminea]
MTTVAPEPRRTRDATPTGTTGTGAPLVPATGVRPHHRVFRVPGVYPVQRDTWLLADVLRAELTDHGCGVARPCRVLELGAGAGALSVVAAGVPCTDVTAVDLSRRALLSTRINAARHGRRVRTRRGDLTAPVAGERFDVVVSNPPYVPAATDDLPTHGLARAFDGGRDGRAVLDRVCDEAPEVLTGGGRLLVVHSAFNDPALTVARLRARGLSAEVVARHEHPYGPVLTARSALLRERGLATADQRTEELVVVRAVRPAA